MTKVKVHSTNIESVGYDPTNQILEIKFISGETYLHHGVPQSVFDSLINADNLGYYLNYYIRNAYPYKKVN
ncbi:KTSC domain-containing protein [Crassaminicella thermophila]|uniref:KTSC domain-containing protein n=1 Tax=Crassaminicella thermophila TaxID=2599308 RepID=A0A5C0SDZ5_CRATE|nr:KTSC domain-containing protein [Crassaminicella thermophila]QEK12795.1 KTSC domain-containing protein [Crassaminicella thermophila]